MPRNKYPEETRQKIIETSLRLFVERGYDETTVLDIVANLGGLTRGAFYHHFKSKEEVLGAIFCSDEFSSKAFERAKNAKGVNGLERLRLALKYALAENTETQFHTEATQLAMALMMSPRFLAEKVKSDVEAARQIEPFIAEGMSDGSIPPGNPKILAELFMVLANFWMMPTIFPGSPEETWQKGELMADILDKIGFPVIDEEMEQAFSQTFEAFEAFMAE